MPVLGAVVLGMLPPRDMEMQSKVSDSLRDRMR